MHRAQTAAVDVVDDGRGVQTQRELAFEVEPAGIPKC